jgi:hypothetical protein
MSSAAMSTRQAPRSLVACSRSNSAYSSCSGVGTGNDSALLKGVMDHRPANLPAPLCEILVHHDHIDRPADPADCIAQADRLGDAVLDIALDDQEVQIAVACKLAARRRSEQDHPGRRPGSLCEALSSQLDQLLCCHD